LLHRREWNKVVSKKKDVENIISTLNDFALEPAAINPLFEKLGASRIVEKQKAQKILLRPDVELHDMIAEVPALSDLLVNYSEASLEQASIQVKYEVYIEKEKELVQRMSTLEELAIPESFDYKKIQALGNEAREKLIKIKPTTLGKPAASPASIQVMCRY
jgi:tRNA uridine 5-carboxymethylaminomethyl modification enzyme